MTKVLNAYAQKQVINSIGQILQSVISLMDVAEEIQNNNEELDAVAEIVKIGKILNSSAEKLYDSIMMSQSA